MTFLVEDDELPCLGEFAGVFGVSFCLSYGRPGSYGSDAAGIHGESCVRDRQKRDASDHNFGEHERSDARKPSRLKHSFRCSYGRASLVSSA